MKTSYLILLTMVVLSQNSFGQTPSLTINVWDNYQPGTVQTKTFYLSQNSSNPSLWSGTGDTWKYTGLDKTGAQQKYTISFTDLTLDADPRLHYSFSVGTDGSNTDFSFIFTLPTAVLTSSTTYADSANLGVTLSGTSGDSLTLSPSSGTAIQSSLVGGNNAGVDLGAGTHAITLDGTGLGSYSTTAVGTYTTVSNNPTITVTNNLHVSATVSSTNGQGDGVSLGVSGGYFIAPEPSTWALMFVGLGLLIFIYRKRTA